MTSNSVIRQTSFDVNVVLEGIAQWDTNTLESFLKKAERLLIQRKNAFQQSREAELIRRIKKGLPDSFNRRFRELAQKSVDGMITEQEHQEMMPMIQKSESWTVERLTYLVELAHLRKTTVHEVMQQLSINPPEDVWPSVYQ